MEDKEFQEFRKKCEHEVNDKERYKSFGWVTTVEAERILNYKFSRNDLQGYCNRGKLPFTVDSLDPMQTKHIQDIFLFRFAKEKGII